MSARSAEWRQACGRVHARAKQLGLDEDARRDLQRRIVGKESCKDMTADELRRVLSHMNGRAPSGVPNGRGGSTANGRARGSRAPANGHEPTRKLRGKLLALWISGWHLGVVRDRTDDGLAEWLRRQLGQDAAWPDAPGMVRAVEALQAWLAREAGVDWSPYVQLGRDGKAREVDRPQARVLEAQWRILHRAGVVEIESTAALGAYACRRFGIGRADSHLALDRGQTIQLMQHFGVEIRRAQIKVVPEPAP